MKEVSLALVLYVGLAIVFGAAVWILSGHDYGVQFFAGWLTEYSLSVDNLFIFIIIMAKFGVPRKYQQEALMVGIVLALVMRAVFIAVGAAAINKFSWIFYLFGLFLVWTAVKLAKEGIERRRRVRGEPADQVGRDAPARHRPVARREDPGQGERQAPGHPDVHRDHRARHHRPALRAGLDPGDLRPDPGAVPGADREHLRADGAAPALLPDRRPAPAAGVPVLRPGDPARLHRHQAGPARDARERAAVHQRRRAHRLGAGHPDPGVAGRDPGDPRGHHGR